MRKFLLISAVAFCAAIMMWSCSKSNGIKISGYQFGSIEEVGIPVLAKGAEENAPEGVAKFNEMLALFIQNFGNDAAGLTFPSQGEIDAYVQDAIDAFQLALDEAKCRVGSPTLVFHFYPLAGGNEYTVTPLIYRKDHTDGGTIDLLNAREDAKEELRDICNQKYSEFYTPEENWSETEAALESAIKDECESLIENGDFTADAGNFIISFCLMCETNEGIVIKEEYKATGIDFSNL